MALCPSMRTRVRPGARARRTGGSCEIRRIAGQQGSLFEFRKHELYFFVSVTLQYLDTATPQTP